MVVEAGAIVLLYVAEVLHYYLTDEFEFGSVYKFIK